MSKEKALWKRAFRLLSDLAVSLLAIGACVASYRWGILALVETTMPLSDAQLTVLRRVGVTAALFFAYLAVARFYERRTVTELTFAPLATSLGALSGAALIGVTLVPLYALGHYRLLSFRGFSAALPILIAIFLGVVFEEVVFRGVVFRLLEGQMGTVAALVSQAAIFGGLHIFNEGTSAMTVVSVTLLGAFWTTLYVYSRNLWVVIAHHVAWNLTIFLTGLPLSGQEHWRAAAPLETGYQGSSWMTGGAFGPEDSILNLVVMTCALAALTHRAWRGGKYSRPCPSPR